MVVCPECGSEDISSSGLKWKCNDCSFEFDKDFGKYLSSDDADIKEEKEFLERLEIELLEKERLQIETKFKEKREELKEEKDRKYNESVSLLEKCDTHIINLLSINNVPDDARSRERKIDELSKQFDSSTLQEKIDALKKEQEEKIKNDASVDSWAFVILILVLLIIIFLSGF